MSDVKESPNYYAIINAKVRYDKSISPNAKLLYGEITALCNIKGYCWASNKYFSELYKVNRSSITHWIKQLVDAGHIRQQLIYADGQPNIKERRLYLTEVSPEIAQPQPQEQAENTQNPETEGGGEIIHQGGGEIFKQGGEKTQESINTFINTSSSSSLPDPPKIAEPSEPEEEEIQNVLPNPKEPGPICQQPDTDPPGVDPFEIIALKQHLKKLNPELIFTADFYVKALHFMYLNQLDAESYPTWLNKFCSKKKVESIAGYFYTVFFQSRFVELYLEATRPPPLPPKITIICTVCGTEYDDFNDYCPQCDLKKDFLYDQFEINRHKKILSMPPDIRKAYKDEFFSFVENSPADAKEMLQKRKSIEIKYGLETV